MPYIASQNVCELVQKLHELKKGVQIMDYIIQVKDRRISFSTDLKVFAYSGENLYRSLEFYSHDATKPCIEYSWKSSFFYFQVSPEDNSVFVTFDNDEALDGIRKKVTEAGIEVREYEV